MLNVERKLLTWGTFAALVATQAACSGETATQPTLGTAASSDTLVGDLATGGDGDAQAPSDATQALDAQEQDSGAQDVVGDTATVDAAPSDDALAGQDADNDSQVALDADPSKTDTDKDGLSDSEEVALGTDPNNADTDGDGLSDGEEVALGTDPKKPDTDGDGLTDGAEVNKYATDPLLPDTDDDGLSDGDEVNKYGTNPKSADTDKDGLADGLEVGKVGDADPSTTTDPTNPDSDGDGVLDGAEDKNKNGKVDAGEADPNNKADGGKPPVTDPCAGKYCDDGNVCTTDACAAGVCSHGANTQPCDDGDACTAGDTCDATLCKPGKNACPLAPVKAYLCQNRAFVPSGSQPALAKSYGVTYNIPATTITSFWLDTRAVLLSEYESCVAAGICPVPAYQWYDQPQAYGGTCVFTGTGETTGTCADPACKCSPAANEPLWAQNIAMAAAYCQWVGGRVMNWGELAWASNQFEPAAAQLVAIPNVPSLVYPWTRSCGLVQVATKATDMNCAGSTCTYTPTGAPCASCYSPAAFVAALAANTTGGKLMYCAFDAKPACP